MAVHKSKYHVINCVRQAKLCARALDHPTQLFQSYPLWTWLGAGVTHLGTEKQARVTVFPNFGETVTNLQRFISSRSERERLLGPFHFSLAFAINQFLKVTGAFWAVRHTVIVDNLKLWQVLYSSCA